MGRVKTEDHFVGVTTKFNVGDIVYRIYHKSDNSKPQIKRLRVDAVKVGITVKDGSTGYNVCYDLSKASVAGEYKENHVDEQFLYASTEELMKDMLQTEE